MCDISMSLKGSIWLVLETCKSTYVLIPDDLESKYQYSNRTAYITL